MAPCSRKWNWLAQERWQDRRSTRQAFFRSLIQFSASKRVHLALRDLAPGLLAGGTHGAAALGMKG